MQEMASLYSAGALSGDDARAVEIAARSEASLHALIGDLQDVASRLALAYATGFEKAHSGALPSPVGVLAKVETRPPSIVTRVLGLEGREVEETPIVVTTAKIEVQWVSPAFTEMCGHTLTELRGRRLPPILHGPETDARARAAMRDAISKREPITQEIVNYHKNGTPYLVSISIIPVPSKTGDPLCFIAKEAKIG